MSCLACFCKPENQVYPEEPRRTSVIAFGGGDRSRRPSAASALFHQPLLLDTNWDWLTKLKATKSSYSNMKEMFDSDKNRFSKYSVKLHTPEGDILVDYSKNWINDEIYSTLMNLMRSRYVPKIRDAMYTGEKINLIQSDAVLHTALRNTKFNEILRDGKDVVPMINKVLEQMKNFTEAVHSGQWGGYTGKPITDCVHIGTGCSWLGPAMVTEALKFYKCGPNVHFISNVDGTHMAETLKNLDHETTLFIIASKTFHSKDTLTNANSAKTWLITAANTEQKVMSQHFIALTSDAVMYLSVIVENKAKEFGIPEKNIFLLWDWVGGAYSIWSSIGLTVAIMIGMENFSKVLDGGHFMDVHFKEASLEHNIPVILAALGIWYSNFNDAQTCTVLPYDQYLHRLPAYLQYMTMQSNGKCTSQEGERVSFNTGPVVWGEAETNGQHSFHQMLHQGTHLIPCDFLICKKSLNPLQGGLHQELLLSNFLAQTEALLHGNQKEKGNAKGVEVHKVCEGNRPTTSIVLQKLTPFSLGLIIAMYEMKTFVQGVVWNINSFDSSGIDLGRELAEIIFEELGDDNKVTTHDSSTNGLINFIKAHRS